MTTGFGTRNFNFVNVSTIELFRAVRLSSPNKLHYQWKMKMNFSVCTICKLCYTICIGLELELG